MIKIAIILFRKLLATWSYGLAEFVYLLVDICACRRRFQHKISKTINAIPTEVASAMMT